MNSTFEKGPQQATILMIDYLASIIILYKELYK